MYEIAKKESIAPYFKQYEKAFFSKNSDSQLVGMKALMFYNKYIDKRYVERAISFLSNPKSVFELRQGASTSLGNIYQDTCNKQTLSFLYGLFINPFEDKLLKQSLLYALLNIVGYDSQEVIFRENDNDDEITLDDIVDDNRRSHSVKIVFRESKNKQNYVTNNLRIFKEEFDKIHRIITS